MLNRRDFLTVGLGGAAGLLVSKATVQSPAVLKTSSGASRVGYSQGATGAVHRTLEAKSREIVSVRDFGAVGDGNTDDASAIQAAIDYVESEGGVLHLNKGEYIVESPLSFSKGNICILGAGFTQGWSLPVYQTTGSSIQLAHTGEAFKMTNTAVGSNTVSNILFSDINIFGKAVDDRSLSAFRWDLGGDAKFSRGFFFNRVGLRFFTAAWLLSKGMPTGGNTTQGQVGDVQIVGCNAQFNTHVVDAYSSASDYVQINGFKFNRNDAGNNDGTGIVQVSMFGGEICGNILEGQVDTVMVANSRGFDVKNNYFEANTGRYVIGLIGDCRAGKVGKNFYSDSCTAEHHVYCGNGYDLDISDKYMALALYDSPSVNREKYDNTAAAERSYGFLANKARPDINAINGKIVRTSAANFRGTGTTFTQTDVKLGHERVALESYTTAGAGGYAKATKTLSANVGDYVVGTFLMLRDDASNLDPYIQFYINNSSSIFNGSWETPSYNFAKTVLDNGAGEEVLVTVYAKALVAMTDVNITIYPYGVSPPAGLVARFSAIELHVVQDVNEIRHSLNLKQLNTAPSIPTTGTWELGDRVKARVPVAGGNIGWVCTAAGTPGTWKAYGSIDP